MTEIHFAGHHFEARTDRTLWHPKTKRLFVSDLHLGKGDVFRQAGVAVPAASEWADLDRLALALTDTDADSLWVLGDLFHQPKAITPRALTHWQSRFAAFQVELCVILGNHDRHGEAFADALGFKRYPEPTAFDALDLAHHPGDAKARPRLAGHVHPQALLQSKTDRLIYPCFAILGQHTLLLPAFTEFSGGPRYRPHDAKLYPITPLGVLPPEKLSPK